VIFDFQTPAGSIPDIASDADFITNFVKPPVHGWALRELRRHVRLTPAQKRHALAVLEKWTRWWLDYRDDDHDGLPQYNHGNDSGWDNATVFAHGTPIEGPDLAAFLVIQMDECARLASELKRPAAARRWHREADALTARLLTHSWRGDRFVAPRSGDHALAPESQSLIPFMPLLLGKRLPVAIREKLVADLRRPGHLLTPYGLATESPKSPLYNPDGYWRGPIWAPSTLLIACALRDCGETAFAADIARRFARACAKGGLAENFDALTGRGLREPAHTWTASGFLVLASQYATSA
jgi:glycogen debranching enzyme